MTAASARRNGRQRGSIEELPSGALRVAVYAGRDPLTGRRHYLREVIPAGPSARSEAQKALRRLANQVDERRNPRTNATVDQLLERYLEQFDGAASTLTLYRGYVRNHISPFLGRIKVGALDADTLDSFYAELRRCRDHCSGRPSVQHRTEGTHQCDHRCGPHQCRPLGATTVRHMHFILSGAYKRAVRWKWVTVSPIGQAEPPAAPVPNPHPPSAPEAARILTEAWKDPDWGTLVWLAMTTGARRGELCALRWSRLDLTPGRAVMWLRRAISRGVNGWVEGDLKTHQQRRVALDPETVEVLGEHLARCRARTETLGLELAEDAFVFSGAPDASTPLTPGSLTQRYDRLVERLGIDTTLHKLRHYSATELIAAGVDVRTVAGRLGHSGGGTTTLKVYSAWVSEADQRAARGLGAGMPDRPTPLDPVERAKLDPQNPYEKIAAELRRRILDGELVEGAPAPTEKQLAAKYHVALGTAHRAMALLKTWGLITSSRGRRATVVLPPDQLVHVVTALAEPGAAEVTPPPATTATSRILLDLEIRRLGQMVKRITTEADPTDARELRQLLVDAIKRQGEQESQIAEYEMDIRCSGASEIFTTFAVIGR
jgi:integrase/DNA-binding transcriptional regulator YhcF (GntR family)